MQFRRILTSNILLASMAAESPAGLGSATMARSALVFTLMMCLASVASAGVCHKRTTHLGARRCLSERMVRSAARELSLELKRHSHTIRTRCAIFDAPHGFWCLKTSRSLRVR